jgi:hypothetical protein
MESTIHTPQSFDIVNNIISRFGDDAFDPEIIDEDGNIAPRFQGLMADPEWSSIDTQIQARLILEFVARLQSDATDLLGEIPF